MQAMSSGTTSRKGRYLFANLFWSVNLSILLSPVPANVDVVRYVSSEIQGNRKVKSNQVTMNAEGKVEMQVRSGCSRTAKQDAFQNRDVEQILNEDAALVTVEGDAIAKERGWRLVLGSHSDDIQEGDEVFTINHLPKAGGTFVKHLITKSLKKQDRKIEHEVDAVTADDLSNNFVVGMVRNPFNYYISLWSYNSGGAGDLRAALDGAQRETVLGKRSLVNRKHIWGDSQDDVLRFRKWVQVVSHEDVGLLSCRFFFSYLQREKSHFSNYKHVTARQIINSGTFHGDSFLDAVRHGFQDFVEAGRSPLAKMCWVRTENIVDDTRSCLEKYEQMSGDGKVDWEAFEEAVATVAHNPTDHASCDAFYDQETIDYVLKSDKYIFEAFPSYARQCPS